MVTVVSAEENEVAFSASSASRWTTSLTAWLRTEMPGCTFRLTRSYCSISETAARSTSTSAIEPDGAHCKAVGDPADITEAYAQAPARKSPLQAGP
jgi:hypothetical protein